MSLAWLFLFAAAFGAGTMNALAGGGSFVTFPALLLAGLDPRAANITSTVALFPGQVTTALVGRALVGGSGKLPFRALLTLSLGGGVLGALLLLATPPAFFAMLVPFLVLFATSVFAWGTFHGKPNPAKVGLGPLAGGAVQFGISIYGGYFGGGIGFLMLAALTMAGVAVRTAGATKNALAAAMNASAVAIFVFSPDVHWAQAGVVAVGAIGGGQLGAYLLKHVNETFLKFGVVAVGAALTVGLFVRAYG